MKVVNRTGNTVYVEDIDTHFPYQNGQTEYINPDILKRSRCLRSFIISGLFDVIEYDENEKIENSIMYLRHKHGSSVEKPKTTECQLEQIDHAEPVNLQSCTDDIEVKIHGIFLDAGGYAKVNRNLALKLSEAGIKVKVDPKRSTNQLTESDLAPIMKLQKTQISRNHILIDSIIPSFAEMSTGKYRVLYTTIESYSVPQQFIDCCQLYDEIWLTSEWSAEVLRKHVKKPIYSVVTGIDPSHYCETGPKFDLRPKVKDFIFISVFGWNYRKGYDVLIRAYLDEFSAEDNVSLLLMSRYQSGQSRYHKNKVGDEIDEFMKEFPNKDLPHIVRFSKITPEKDMPKIYRACDCFVLPSRGEGGCHKPGTKIITNHGLENIELIDQGTKVLTHMGRFMDVTDTRCRYTEETMYKIKTSLNIDAIELTGEHPVRVLQKNLCIINGKQDKTKFSIQHTKWLLPSEIEPNDYVIMPLNFCSTDGLSNIYVSEYIKNINVRNGTVFRTVRRDKFNWECGVAKSCVDKVNINQSFLRMIGFYIAEGSNTVKGTIRLDFHKNETHYHSIVQNAFIEHFGDTLKPENHHNDGRQFRHRLQTNNSIVSEFLGNICGQGAHNKKIPDFVWSLSQSQIFDLLYGLFGGDGNFYTPKNTNSPELTLSTVSQQLANDTVLLLRSVGISPCLKYSEKRGYVVLIKGNQLNEMRNIKGSHFNGKITEQNIRTKSYAFIRVKSIEKYLYCGNVYNLEVDEDQSYTTNCFTVHNCLPPLEASMCGLPVIMTNCSGQQGYLRHDNAYLLEIDHLSEIKPGQMHLHYWDGQQFPALTTRNVHDNLKGLMRTVVNNKEEAKLRNRNLQNMILENFTWNNTANQAIIRLQEIQKKLKG